MGSEDGELIIWGWHSWGFGGRASYQGRQTGGKKSFWKLLKKQGPMTGDSDGSVETFAEEERGGRRSPIRRRGAQGGD